MFKQFINTAYIQYKEADLNLQTLYQNIFPVRVLYDAELSIELEQFLQFNTSSQVQLSKFIRKLATEHLITPWKCDQLINGLGMQANDSTGKQMVFMTDDKHNPTAQFQEEVQHVQISPGVYMRINELSLQNKPCNYIIAKVINKPFQQNVQLSSAIDFFLQVRDDTGVIQLVFIKKRLKDKFMALFNQLQLQCTYRIENFETNRYNDKLEIKVSGETIIELVEQQQIEYTVDKLVTSSHPAGEELDVIVVVIEVDEAKQKFRKIVVGAARIGSNECLKIGFTLWDDHKFIEFNRGDIIAVESCLFVRYGDAFELRSTKLKMSVYKQPKPEHQQAWKIMEELRELWFQAEFQPEVQEIVQFKLIKDMKLKQRYNIVAKVLDVESLAVLQLSNQKLKTVVTITNDNVNSLELHMIGEQLSNMELKLNETVVFTNICLLNGLKKELLTIEGATQIKDVNEFKNCADWDLIDYNVEILKRPFINGSQSVSRPPSTNTAQKLRIVMPANSAIKRSNDVNPILTLQQGKSVTHKFAAFVIIQKQFEINYTKSAKPQKIRDILIMDESMNGKITLWNDQINNYDEGSTVFMDNIYFDASRNEFKTTLQTQIRTDVPQKVIQKQQSTVLSFELDMPLKSIEELLILQQENNEHNYYYSRGMIVEVTVGKAQLKCPTCFNQKIVQTEAGYECNGENQQKQHIVGVPKIYCFVKAKVADMSSCLDAILSDDTIERVVTQQQMKDSLDQEQGIKPYFDQLLYKDCIMKYQFVKQRDDQKKIKLLKIFATNYKKENTRLFDILTKQDY